MMDGLADASLVIAADVLEAAVENGTYISQFCADEDHEATRWIIATVMHDVLAEAPTALELLLRYQAKLAGDDEYADIRVPTHRAGDALRFRCCAKAAQVHGVRFAEGDEVWVVLSYDWNGEANMHCQATPWLALNEWGEPEFRRHRAHGYYASVVIGNYARQIRRVIDGRVLWQEGEDEL